MVKSPSQALWGTERPQGSSGVCISEPNASAIVQERHGHYLVDSGADFNENPRQRSGLSVWRGK